MARYHLARTKIRYILLAVGIVVAGLQIYTSTRSPYTNMLLMEQNYYVDGETRNAVFNVSARGHTRGNAIPGSGVFLADSATITDSSLLSWSTAQSNFHLTNTWLDLVKRPGLISKALRLSTKLCSGSVVTFSDYAVLFSQAVLNPTFVEPRLTMGGETLQNAMINGTNLNENLEFFSWKPGFLTVNCNEYVVNASKLRKESIWKDKDKPEFFMTDNSVIPLSTGAYSQTKLNGLTVGIIRYEYANLYWTLMDLYNVYLVSRLLEADASLTKVLIMDIHPHGSLDGFWSTLFQKILLLGHLKDPISPATFVLLGIKGREILMNANLPVPLFSDFRKFVYDRHGLEYRDYVKPELIKCTLVVGFNILVILRRDYVAHVRNPSGNVQRKFLNEAKLMTGLRNEFPNATIAGVQLDLLTTSAQITSIALADIVLGMHGAGLAYAALQRQGTGMIEIFLKKYATSKNPHMETLARQNGVHYLSWTNRNDNLERVNSLDVPIDIVVTLIRTMRDTLCGIPHPDVSGTG